MVPVMGPLTDWFFGLLHARQMEGQLLSLSSHFCCVSILTFIHLWLHFS